MRSIFKIIPFICLAFGFLKVSAQDLKTNIGANKKLEDSLRNALDGHKDSVVFTAKFIRYTTLGLVKDLSLIHI